MITDYKTYEEAQAKFKQNQVWELFDGNREHFNIAHECIDRHPPEDTSIRIKFEDGHTERSTFGEISVLLSKFAHALEKLGIDPDDRVAVMLELSRHEYPREIEFVDEIPKTEGGRINRKEVKKWTNKK